MHRTARRSGNVERDHGLLMSPCHAKFLRGSRLPWGYCESRYAIHKLFSASAKSLRVINSNLLAHRYVIEEQQGRPIWIQRRSLSEAPVQRSENNDERGSSSTLLFPPPEHWNSDYRHALKQETQPTLDTSEPQQSVSSRSRLLVGSQSSSTNPVHSRRRFQSVDIAPARFASRRRRAQISRKISIRRGSERQPFHFISLVSWQQSEKGKQASDHVERFSRQLWRWNRKFARLYRGEVIDIDCPILEGPLGSRLLREEKDQIPHLWKQLSTTLNLSFSRRRSVWQRFLLWALQHDHGRALTFLNAAVLDPIGLSGVSRYAVEDAFKYLVSVYLREKAVSKETINALLQLLCNFAQASKTGNNHTPFISQKIIHLLLRHSNNYQAQTIYGVLIDSQLNIHPRTLTHFINTFARQGRPDLAMDALRRIAGSGSDVTSDTVQYSCIALLRTRFDEVESYRIQSHLVTEMLELGIRPGIPMLNAMILNAVEACDYQTAQAMFETARAHGIRRDTITYSTLLKVALQSSDANLVEKIMQMAEEDGALPRNNQLVFCLVGTILQIAQAEETGIVSSASRYKTMLQFYARYCDIRPLQDLGIVLNANGETKVTNVVSQPSPQLLSVMILGYIRLFGRNREVKELYYRYQSLIAQDHHLIASTAETEHLANAFLLCLGRSKTTFTMCPVILRDMLEPPVSTTVKVAKPTVQTWSIVLRSYFFNNQRAAGEKILQMMRANSVKPDQVTMNTIISGYAKMQDASAAVNAMQQMEAAGLQVDSYTLKGLTRIVNRDELLDALRKVAAKPIET